MVRAGFASFGFPFDGVKMRLSVVAHGMERRRGFRVQQRFAANEQRAGIEVAHAVFGAHSAQKIIHPVERQRARMVVHHQADGRLAAANEEIRKLAAEIIIDHRVGNLRPAVHDVPPDQSRAPAAAAAEGFDKEFLRYRLRDLAHARVFVEGLRLLP